MGSKNFGCVMVKARPFDFSTDYDILTLWWNAHDSFPPDPEYLSSTGIVVEVQGKPVCAGFLYDTDSKMCVFEFVVSNPTAKKRDRHNALNHLIKMIQGIAKERKYRMIYTSISIEAYVRKLKNAGFFEADKNQTHMFYSIGS